MELENIIKKYFGSISDFDLKRIENSVLSGQMERYLLKKYKKKHEVINDKKLYDFVMEYKERYLKKASSISKITYDNKIKFNQQALGLHIYNYSKQGSKTVRKNIIKISNYFINTPFEFLEHIVVHELVHLKIKEHDKSFYRFCLKMQANYNEIESDIRFYLVHKLYYKKEIWK